MTSPKKQHPAGWAGFIHHGSELRHVVVRIARDPWAAWRVLANESASGTLRGRFARAATWAGLGTISSQGLTVVYAILVARALGAVGYGELTVITSTVVTLGVFAGLGLGVTATKHVAEQRQQASEKAGRTIALVLLTSYASCALMAAAILFGAPVIARRMLNAPSLLYCIRISALLVVGNAIQSAQTGVLAGFEDYRSIAISNTWRAGLNLLFGCYGAWHSGVSGALWGSALGLLVACAITERAIGVCCKAANFRVSWRNCWSEWRTLYRFSLPALMSNVMVTPITWLAALVVVHTPGGYREMGLFNAANQWRAAVVFLPTLISQTALPLIASLNAVDVRRASRVVWKIAGFAAAGGVGACVLLVPAAGIIMALYGHGFAGSGALLKIVLLTAVVVSSLSPFGDLIAARGDMWLGLLMNSGWAAVLLVGTHALIAAGYGAVGLAASYLLAYIVHGGWTLWYAVRVARLHSTQTAPFQWSPSVAE